MKKIIPIFIAIAILSSSCTRLFLQRKVNITTNEDAKIYVNQIDRGKTSTTVDMKRYKYRDTSVEIVKDGYKTKNDVLLPGKRSYPAVIASTAITTMFGATLSDFEFNQEHMLVTVPFAFLLSIGYTRNFDKEKNYELEAFPKIADSNRLVNFARIVIDTNEIEYEDNFYKSIKKWKEGVKTSENVRDRLKIQPKKNFSQYINEYYKEGKTISQLNSFLKDIGANDPNSLRYTYYRDYTIYGHVKKVKLHQIIAFRNPQVKYFEITSNYKLKNKFGDTVIDTLITSKSDLFFHYRSTEKLFYDAMEYGILGLMKSQHVLDKINSTEKLVREKDIVKRKELFNYNKKASINLENINKLSYYVKFGDQKSIGLPIKENGLLAFSKTATDIPDSLYVYNHKGDSVLAKPYFEMTTNELMILKTEQKFDTYFQLSEAKMNIGDECILAGFDRYFNTTILSKGIIGAKRDQENHPVYQIDAESSHMIFPAVISRSGKLYGFISGNMDSYDVNSIAFFPSLQEE